MQEIEIAGRVVLGIAVFMALRLGLKMLFRKEEVAVEVKEGMTRYRWVFQAIVGLLALWYIVDPASRPTALVFTLPVWAMLTGMVLTCVSFTIRVWAQVTLGRMWSEKIRAHPDHVVVRVGPYRYAAHPIYLSYFPLSVGLFLLTGDWVMGVAGFMYALFSWHRVPTEDSLMARVRRGQLEVELRLAKQRAEAWRCTFGQVPMELAVEIARLEFYLQELSEGMPAVRRTRQFPVGVVLVLAILALNVPGMLYELALILGAVR